MGRLRRKLSRARTGREPNGSGSLPLAMVVVISGFGLTMALASSVVVQVTATRIDRERADALLAAQSGLDTVAAQIRSATDSSGGGRLALLPCDSLSGTAGPTAAAGLGPPATYTVGIAYYQFDPSRATGNPVLACYAGSGTATVPGYVVLTSAGRSGRLYSRTRTIMATYILRTTNQNIAGGQIRVWRMPSAPFELCLDTGPVMPTGSNVVDLRVQLCDGDDPQQLFAYHNNLNLVYVPSKTNALPLGMCLDAGANPADQAPVRFRPCANTTIAQQQWSYTDSRNFVGTNASSDYNDLCFNLENGVVQPNTRVVLRHKIAAGCYVGPDNNTQMFIASAKVGAGAAESAPNQLVNFGQFGRCMDVTLYEVAADFLIAYACKQAPKPEKVNWNQRFVLPTLTITGEVTSGTGRIFTELVSGDYEMSNQNVTGKYCLTTQDVTAAAPYVTIKKCPATAATPTHMQWVVVRGSTDYTTSYRVETTVAGEKKCLAAGSKPADIDVADIGKIVLETCGDSLLQKWNAPAYLSEPTPLTDIRER